MDNKIIIISGYCATGKSTFSMQIGKELDIPCFNKDTLKEALADSIDSKNDSVIGSLSNTTFDVMLYIAEKMMTAHNIFVLESNFKVYEIERLKSLIEKYEYECLTYLFTGDLKVLYKRYKERDSIRHWVHTRGPTREDIFIEGQKQLGEINIGKMICVNATDFDDIDYNFLISTTKNFITA